VSCAQLLGHVASDPSHTYGLHEGLVPALPAGSTTHAPAAQLPHGPHAVLQHTPATQLPLAHWSGAEHDELFDSLTVHWPPLQKAPGAQLASTAQLVGHVTSEPLHANGLHVGLPTLPAASGEHVPVPQVPHEPHALLQHVPATQLPLVHWSVAVQLAPLPPFAVHTPPLQ
jgi:hypothetical protein